MLAPATSPASPTPLELLRLTLTAPWPHDQRLLRRLTVRALRHARELLARRQALAAQPQPTRRETTQPQPPMPPATVALANSSHSPRSPLPDNTIADSAPARVTPHAARSPLPLLSRSDLRFARRAVALALRAHKTLRRVPEMHVVLNE